MEEHRAQLERVTKKLQEAIGYAAAEAASPAEPYWARQLVLCKQDLDQLGENLGRHLESVLPGLEESLSAEEKLLQASAEDIASIRAQLEEDADADGAAGHSPLLMLGMA